MQQAEREWRMNMAHQHSSRAIEYNPVACQTHDDVKERLLASINERLGALCQYAEILLMDNSGEK